MGDGVNIAARLEGIAKPGAICLSEQAYWQVKSRLDLAASDLGAIQLKNIAEPVRVYALEVGKPQARPTKPAPSTQRSIPLLLGAGIVALVAIAGSSWYFLGANRPATVTSKCTGGAGRSRPSLHRGAALYEPLGRSQAVGEPCYDLILQLEEIGDAFLKTVGPEMRAGVVASPALGGCRAGRRSGDPWCRICYGFRAYRFPCLSKSIKYPLEEQDAQADDHQRDADGGSYSQDLVHPYLRLEAPTP